VIAAAGHDQSSIKRCGAVFDSTWGDKGFQSTEPLSSRPPFGGAEANGHCGWEELRDQGEPWSRTFVGLTAPTNKETSPMICQFCHQDVKNPYHDVQEMRQRAMRHVDRCEEALKNDLSDGINPSDGQSAGSI